MQNRKPAKLIDLLKALADESRLSLLRMLHEGEYNVGDLANKIGLGEPTVSHHLSRLRAVGLVTLRMAGSQRYYRINETGLAHFKALAAEIEQPPPTPAAVDADESWIDVLGWSAADQQVLREHTSGGQIVFLPTRQKKLLVLLRWLASRFEPERRYSEAEVNETLKAVYAEDYVSLRRDMVDLGYLRRERGGGKYWLAPELPEDT
jgi:DNA-binding HxlR family transcriptional regulator